MEYITYAGEPAIDTSWAEKLKSLKQDDHLHLMTKNPGAFIKSKLEYAITQHKDKITIYSCITGYGKSAVEPGVTTTLAAMMSTKYLMDQGFDVVLYIKPIFPTTFGFQNVMEVIDTARRQFGSLKDLRIQFDFIERIENEDDRGLEYPWVTEEFEGLPTADNPELNIVSCSTIVDYFKSIEEKEGAMISTTNTSVHIEAWHPNKVQYFEFLEGDDVYRQCQYKCRYCNMADHITEENV